MKKYWIVLIIIVSFMFPIPANAEKMLVKVLDNCSFENPAKEFSIILPEAIKLRDGKIIEKNSILHGEISDVIEPKRLKKDAYFIFITNYYTIPSDNHKVIKIENKMESKIKYYEKFKLPEKKEVAKITIGCIIPGLDYAISFAEGVAKPDDNRGRFKTGCKNVVESWPFSYCLKGRGIEIKSETMAIFDFNKKMFEQ